MDTSTSKKRPGGDIESPFATGRKIAKASTDTATPHTLVPPVPDEDVLTPEEVVMVRMIAPFNR